MNFTSETFETGDMVAFAEKYLGDTQHWQKVKKASNLWEEGKWSAARNILESLPSEEELLKQLVERLKGKSVYKTLKRIEEGSLKKGPQFLKGLCSLGTHVCIEIEQGRKEYAMLLPIIYQKFGEILYDSN